MKQTNKGLYQQHISRQFDNLLEKVRDKALAMGGLVETQLDQALRSLNEADVELAEQVIGKEIEVNSYEVAIDLECIQILAKHHPAATDLRLVTAISKVTTDLERIGDEAQKIAKMSIKLSKTQHFQPLYGGIKTMSNLVCRMLHDTLDAFARLDAKSALSIAGKEPESDEQYTAILRHLITYMMEDPRNISASIDVVWVARALERIGDHARNICEYIIYLVEGKDVRHVSIEQMRKVIGADLEGDPEGDEDG